MSLLQNQNKDFKGEQKIKRKATLLREFLNLKANLETFMSDIMNGVEPWR